MLKKLHFALEKWGYYLLALLCIAVIIFSALWTRRMNENAIPDAQVISDGSQRLQNVTPSPLPKPVCTPAGEFLRGYSETPVYFPALGIWQCHKSVDFAIEKDLPVWSIRDGTVQVNEKEIRIRSENGETILYRGCKEIWVKNGQSVEAGDKIGLSGGSVPFEEDGHLCVTWLKEDEPFDGFKSLKPF